jgi:hypothetical protein
MTFITLTMHPVTDRGNQVHRAGDHLPGRRAPLGMTPLDSAGDATVEILPMLTF